MSDLLVPAFAAMIAVAAGTWTFHRPSVLRRPGSSVSRSCRRLSIVVPARDEARNLPTLLSSIVPCEGVELELIVVDDGSTDGTAALARAAGAQVVAAGSPPPNWLGKTWACHVGSAAATGDVLLFLDADTWLAPDAIDALLAAVEADDGLVSVQPFHCVWRPYERLSAVFNLVSVMGSGSFGRRPDRPASVAFGPCLITRRDAYAESGGHEAVRAEVVEDIALAAQYRRTGQNVTCSLGGDLVRFRMYAEGVRSLVEGWTKNIVLGATRAPIRHIVPTIVWVAAVTTIWAALLVGLVRSAPEPGALGVAALAWVVVTAHIARMLRRLGTFGWATSVGFVVPLAFFVAVFVRSAVLTGLGRPVRWRGRTVLARPSRSRSSSSS